MPINQLQLPTYAAPRQIDFSSLAALPQVYQKAQADQLRKQTLAELGQGGQIDPMRLIQSGDMNLANLGIGLMNRQQEQARQAQQDARQAERDRVLDTRADRQFAQQQAYQNRSLGIQETAAKRRDVPSGFEQNPEGGLRPITGGPADPTYKRTTGDRQNAPSGYLWNDANDPSKGLTAIPGGPGEKISAEVAARVGLAKSFIGQLDDYKDAEGNQQKGLRARIKAGEATGLIDGTMGAANVGESGSIRRKISSGAEALLRNLTGAGMNIDEAKKYVSRYEPQWNDSASTLLDKVNQLDRELRSVTDVVGKGRGGSILEPPARTTGPTSETREIPKAAIDALRANPQLKDQFEAKYGRGTAGVVSR